MLHPLFPFLLLISFMMQSPRLEIQIGMVWKALSGSFLFPLFAYICAFLPWSALAATDFINAKWVTVRRTRIAGYRNLMFTLFPMAYVFLYAVVQYKEGDYKEMAGAVVATIFAFVILVRTIWGLYQLHMFYKWARDAIDALKSVGIDYTLLRLEMMNKRNQEIQERIKKRETEKPQSIFGTVRREIHHGFYRWLYEWTLRTDYSDLTSDYIADEILVNETIADNQVRHGEVICTFRNGNAELLNGESSDSVHIHTNRWGQTVFGTFSALFQSFDVALRMVFFLSRALIGLFRRKTLRNMLFPRDPVQVWVQWASTFASQGLQKWMHDFDLTVDHSANKKTRKAAKKNLDDRRKAFSWELLASACIQLWPDHGPGTGVSPFLWKWEEDSEISDGRFVKQKLFEDAIRTGNVLPYGSPHVTHLLYPNSGDTNPDSSYANYAEAIKAFISRLPITNSYVIEMRKFDVNMLEWLTVMIHLGHKFRSESKRDLEIGADDIERSTGIRNEHKQEVEEILIAQMGFDEHPTGSCELCRPSCSLHSHESECRNSNLESNCIFLSTPILRNMVAETSEANRLVSKAGQFVDVWVSLVSGQQISFLADNLNEEWKSICLLNCENSGIRERHKELEIRRLERRIAFEEGRRYRYLDQGITFMGYRMESVRTAIGRWVKGNEQTHSNGDKFFESVEFEGISVRLSGVLRRALTGDLGLKILERRAVQCRLIWELQNELEKQVMNEHLENQKHSEHALATMMLLLLSFPGLRLSVPDDALSAGYNGKRQRTNFSCINLVSDAELEVNHDTDGYGNNLEQSLSSRTVSIEAVCAPQELKLKLDLTNLKEKHHKLNFEKESNEEFNWKHWRDAFHGRLQGLEEWQKKFGINKVRVENECFENSENFIEKRTREESTIILWTEWLPFRTEFCRFELESEEFLKEVRYVGEFENLLLPIVQKIPVPYAAESEDARRRKASYETLKRYCTVVKRHLEDPSRRSFPFHGELNPDISEEWCPRPSDSTCTISNPLCRDIIEARFVLRAIFDYTLDLGRIRSTPRESISFVDVEEDQVPKMLENCKWIMERAEVGGTQKHFCRLAQFLITCLIEDSGRYQTEALRLIYRLLSLCDDKKAEEKILEYFGSAMRWCIPIADGSRPMYEGYEAEQREFGRRLKRGTRFASLLTFISFILCKLYGYRRLREQAIRTSLQ